MIPVTSKIWMMNALLAAGIVVFGFMAADVWTQQKDADLSGHLSVTKAAQPSPKRIDERTLPAESTYNSVAEKNLFSPDRAESPAGEATEPESPGIVSKQKIFLYGIVTLDGKKQALINYPETGAGVPRGQTKDRWVKAGDSIGDLSVARIDKDRIVLREGASEHEISLHDDNKPVRQQKTVTPGSSTPVVVVTDTSPEPVATSAAPEAAVSQPASAAGKREPDKEYKIIQSPFGPIKRRIK